MSDQDKNLTAECAECRRLMELHLDGRLSFSQRIEMTRHLRGCEHCRRTLAELLALDRLLQELPRHHAPADFARDVSRRLRRVQPSWTRVRGPTVPLPWRALFVETIAALLVVSLGAAWVSRGAGWHQLDRAARTATHGVTVLARQGRQAWTPRPVPLADVTTAIAQNYRVFHHAVVRVVQLMAELPGNRNRWFSWPSFIVWGVVGFILLLNLVLEIAPLPTNARHSRRFSA